MSVLKITFSNSSGYDDSEVSIGFLSGKDAAAPSMTNVNGGAAINTIDGSTTEFPAAGNWYSLSDLSDGVNVTSFSGRIYVCYGTTWEVQYAGYEPAQAVTDPNFFLRYDKMELTFTGDPNDVADLTSIDYWSIPMSLETKLAGVKVETANCFLNGATAQSIYTTLTALTTPPVTNVPGPGGPDGTPLPANVPGQFVQYPSGPAPLGTFGRVIGPSSYPPSFPAPGGIPVSPYDTQEAYLTYLNTTFGVGTTVGATVAGLGNGVIASIKGNFAGVGPNVPPTGPQSAQTYDLSATIDSDLTVTLTGTVSGVEGTTTMVFTADSIYNSDGFYGGNAAFTLNGASSTITPANDVYGWVCGDLFSGLNIGALGSSVAISGTAAGAMESSKWFTDIPNSDFFSGLQPGTTYYNQWAAALSQLTDAYNFAYTDRFAHVLVSLNPATVDQLEISLPDGKVAITD